MSIIGIDFGNESSLVTAAKAGFIETLTNDYSLRATPSCVAFDEKKRIIGVAAKNQQVTNMPNTISGYKHLLGRKFNDPHVQRELKFIPATAEQLPDGNVGFKVSYLGKEAVFTPIQLVAMLLTKLKEIAVLSLQSQVNDCVITCPVFFTNAERKALLDACQIAGINVLRLMNETTATALNYGFYKADLPEDKPRNVIFVDCGHSSLQVSAVAFNKGRLKVLASTWDHVGGRDFDAVLAEHFAKEFQERYKINARSNGRAYLRLLAEVEKLKKQMSANSTRLPMAIECFMGDIDVQSHLQRTQMEELCAHLFKRVETTFKKLLHESKLTVADIHSVEIVGGSTRIPAIKHLIEELFGKPASTTLNQDESVSSGATLQCALMSPAMRARDFGVTDIQNYAVKVSWEPPSPNGPSDLLVFPTYHQTPYSKLLTIGRKEPFVLTVQYAEEVPFPDPIIGKWIIKDVKPNENGEQQDVKIKVRVNNHGLVLVSGASLLDKKEVEDHHAANNAGFEEKATNDEPANAGDTAEPMQEAFYDVIDEENNSAAASSPGGQGWAQRVKGWFGSTTDKKKRTQRMIELPMEAKTHGCTAAELNELIEKEAKMIGIDAKEKERADARNALEEYIYEMRDRLQEGGPLDRYTAANEREGLSSQLYEVANWLYEDGEEADTEVYDEKLRSLRNRTTVINSRAYDYEQCPGAFEELKQTIMLGREAAHEFKRGSSKYDHLLETDFINITEACDKAQKWYKTNLASFTQSPRTADCPIQLHQIHTQEKALSELINGIIKRPKPKTADEKTQPKDAGAGTQSGGENAEHNGDEATDKAKSNEGGAHVDDSTMDVE